MTRLIAASLVAALFVVSASTTGVRQALACSVGPDFDPVRDSDIIVEGRVLGYEILPNESGSAPIPVRVTLDVHRIFKGSVTTNVLAMIDRGSLFPNQSGYTWSGSGGSCGAFNSDPTGSYGIMGLSQQEDGTYSTSGPLWFFHGGEPAGSAYEETVARLTLQLGPGTLPSAGTGDGPPSDANGELALGVASALAALGSILLSASLRRRSA